MSDELAPAFFDHRGQPIAFRKADPPKTGPSFGDWAGHDKTFLQFPGGSALQFNLDRLTLADLRSMKDHYQINASLTVLAFMIHQLDWHIKCEDKKIADAIEKILRVLWTRLIRALSQAHWAGYSPTAIEYENDNVADQVVISKFKDLLPEECKVKWKEVDAAVVGNQQKKLKIFDGMTQYGWGDIPVENTLWYPLLMENGDYYGRKLLRSAFPAWYFSMLIHLFANRYYERFGEPLPIGRAPFDEDVEMGGQTINGRDAMIQILDNLRNRGTVTLPSNVQPLSHASTKAIYDYDISYLESQMRGGDFERYLDRLDEEMSLSLFTPLLILKTADVGSYNLGVGHMQMYLIMLNALAGDMKEYIDRYVIERLKAYNFSPNAPRAEIVFRKLGKDNAETIRAVITELIRTSQAKPNLDELGQALGMSIQEIRQIQTPESDSTATDPRTGRNDRGTTGKGLDQPRATARQIAARARAQIEKAWRENRFGRDLNLDLGHQQRFTHALEAEGFDRAADRTTEFYGRVGRWLRDAIDLGQDQYAGPEDFMAMLDRVLDTEVDLLGVGA